MGRLEKERKDGRIISYPIATRRKWNTRHLHLDCWLGLVVVAAISFPRSRQRTISDPNKDDRY